MRSSRQWMRRIRSAAFAAAMAYAIPGGCPPPPGTLIPDYQTFSFGDTAVGATGRLEITFRLNPAFASFAPITVRTEPYFFHYNEESAFAVDASRSTCVTGFAFTASNSCVLTVTFSPRSFGRKRALWFGLETCLGPSPSCPTSGGRGATANFVGDGVVEVPTLSRGMQLLLILAVAALFVRGLRKRNAS